MLRLIPKVALISTTILLAAWYILQREFCHLNEYFKKYLVEIHDLLQMYDIEFWPNGGALLGFLRNQQLLPWDYDIDLNIMEDQLVRIVELKTEFEKLGYQFYTRNDYIPYKHNHKIKLPAIIMYTKPTVPLISMVRFHIEFYDWKEMTLTQARCVLLIC